MLTSSFHQETKTSIYLTSDKKTTTFQVVETIFDQAFIVPMLPIDQGNVVEYRRVFQDELGSNVVEQNENAYVLFDVSKSNEK